MTDEDAIRKGLAANLKTLHETQVSAYMLSNYTPPCCYVMPGENNYHQAMGGTINLQTFIVVVLVPFTADVASQKRLGEYRASTGVRSVKAAIEADTTLGGICDDLEVVKASAPQVYTHEQGPPSLGCEFTVTVYV